jgi:hypothetical protein
MPMRQFPFDSTRLFFHWLRCLLLMVATFAVASTASAMSLREFRALEKSGKQGVDYASYYLVGVLEGVLEAHAMAVRAGATPVICLNGRRLEPHMARSLYATELKRSEGLYEADMPVPLVLANALQTVYACQ